MPFMETIPPWIYKKNVLKWADANDALGKHVIAIAIQMIFLPFIFCELILNRPTANITMRLDMELITRLMVFTSIVINPCVWENLAAVATNESLNLLKTITMKELGLLLSKFSIDRLVTMLTVKALGMKLVKSGMDELASQNLSAGITLLGIT
jgi:hypothetical protein